MHGFKAFFGNKTHDVYATDMFAAKTKAVAHWGVRKSQQHMVSVVLCEKDVQMPEVGKPCPQCSARHGNECFLANCGNRPKGTPVVHSTAGV
jgi:hypothetical protein